jgi:hypothetical protein
MDGKPIVLDKKVNSMSAESSLKSVAVEDPPIRNPNDLKFGGGLIEKDNEIVDSANEIFTRRDFRE